MLPLFGEMPRHISLAKRKKTTLEQQHLVALSDVDSDPSLRHLSLCPCWQLFEFFMTVEFPTCRHQSRVRV